MVDRTVTVTLCHAFVSPDTVKMRVHVVSHGTVIASYRDPLPPGLEMAVYLGSLDLSLGEIRELEEAVAASAWASSTPNARSGN